MRNLNDNNATDMNAAEQYEKELALAAHEFNAKRNKIVDLDFDNDYEIDEDLNAMCDEFSNYL